MSHHISVRQRTRRAWNDTEVEWKRECGIAALVALCTFIVRRLRHKPEGLIDDLIAIAIAVVAAVILLPILQFAWNFVRASRRILDEENTQLAATNSSLQKELSALKDGIPNLRCRSFSSEVSVPIHDGRHVFGTPTFYHMNVVNEPRGLVDRKIAGGVAATVSIFRDGMEICPGKIHRWAHTFGPYEVGRRADILQTQDIVPNGIPINLDIAMKYEEDAEFYTPTNDTATKYKDFRDPRYKFPPGEYVASVRLAGNNVNTVLKCVIVNRGKGEKLDLAPLGD